MDWSRIQRLIEFERELDYADGLVVRSNAPAESSERRRGAYESTFVAPDPVSIRDGIDAVLDQQDRDHAGLCAIVQVAARRVRGGHLSNERRVTPRRTVWLAEDLDVDGARVGNAYTIDSRAFGTSLDAANDREVTNALKAIAGHLTEGELRCHCEWIWDGSRVWVVQRDAVSSIQNDRLDRYLRRRDELAYPPRSHSNRLRCVRRVEASSAAAWSKSSRPVIFDALGMPTAEVFLLTGDVYTVDAAQGGAGVRADLQALLDEGSPVVLRCDVGAACGADDLSLPTSDPLTEVSDAIDFMTNQAERFAAAGLPVGEWAFLPAHLVPARASVMVHARPGAQRVRLDALWGFPDGVGLLPHDTWFRDMASGRLTERVQHKGSCLAYDHGDGWQFQPVPAPHDWGHVLNKPEATIASSWARRVADHLQREVQLMVLIRIGGRRGPEAMIPWHFTDHVVPGSAAAVPRAPERGVMVCPVLTICHASSLRGSQASASCRPYGPDAMPTS